MKKYFLFLLFFVGSFFSLFAQDFKGDVGIYILGNLNQSIASTETLYARSFVDGGVLRVTWDSLEYKSPGNYQFEIIDEEIQRASAAGKKLSIAIVGQPLWLVDDLGAQGYYYTIANPNNPDVGTKVKVPLEYDPIVIERYKNLMDTLAAKYAEEETISYFHIFSDLSNDLPDTASVSEDAEELPFDEVNPYNPDDLIDRLKELTDHYMQLFPNTPLWNSPDRIRFEKGRPQNYVASEFMAWGATTYPERFGVWREDLSGCVIAARKDRRGHWYVVDQHHCRTGAQMVWNVQDGPDRMNRCKFTPRDSSITSKINALDSAVNAGLSVGMRYFEIYRADLIDPNLEEILVNIHDRIFNYVQENCAENPIQAAKESIQIEEFSVIFPNPSSSVVNITSSESIDQIQVFDAKGNLVEVTTLTFGEEGIKKLDFGRLPSGMYLIHIIRGVNVQKKRVFIDHGR